MKEHETFQVAFYLRGVCLAARLLWGCSGQVSSEGDDVGPAGSEGGGGTPSGPAPTEPRASPQMRRLSRHEINQTLNDLLGTEVGSPADAFPADPRKANFENNASALGFPPVLAEQMWSLARQLSQQRAATLAGCADASANCGRSFIESFGKRAWRRPLEAAEVDRLMKVFDMGSGESFARGIEMAAQTIMLSLPFIYRVEVGTSPAPQDPEHRRRLSSWEMASRLSYTLWNTMPDEELFEAAEQDRLGTEADMQAQVERMLTTPRGHGTISEFHRQWLNLSSLGAVNKDPERFPKWSDVIARGLAEELSRFLDEVAFEGNYKDLFTSQALHLNETLAKFYGLDLSLGKDIERVQVTDPRRAGGLLTHAGLFSLLSGFDQTSPTVRGHFVREQLLCDAVASPPPTVDNTPPSLDKATTGRARYQAYLDAPACGDCHRLMDPIGFGLEAYDASGVHRTEEGGQSIDDSGEVVGHAIGRFSGAAELAQGLAASDTTRACLATQWLRFALGRLEVEADEPLIEALSEALANGSGYLGMIRAFTRSDAFLYLHKGDAP